MSKNTIIQSIAWIFYGNFSFRIIKFGSSIVLARLLVPEDFGILVTTQVFTGVLGIVTSGGLGESLIRSKDVGQKEFNSVFTVQLIICILIYCLLFFISTPLAQWFENDIYKVLIPVTAISFLLRPFISIHSVKLRREMRFKELTLIRIVSVFCGIVLSIALAMNSFGVWSLVFGGLFGPLVRLILLIKYVGPMPSLTINLKPLKKIYSYGAKSTVNNIIFYLRGQSVNLYVSKIFGAHTLGLFNKSTSLADMPIELVTSSSYQPLFTALSKEQDDLDKSRYLYSRAISVMLILTFPIYVSLFFMAEPFIILVYGEKWAGVVEPLQLLCGIGMLRPIIIISGAVIAAQDLLTEELKAQILSWFILMLGFWIVSLYSDEILILVWALFPSYLFLLLRMAFLASSAIKFTFKAMLNAVLPSLFFSMLLVVYYWSISLVWHDNISWLYLFFVPAIGMALLAVIFLSIPLKTYDTERVFIQQKLTRLIKP